MEEKLHDLSLHETETKQENEKLNKASTIIIHIL